MEKLIIELKDVLKEELSVYENMLSITTKKTEIITSGSVKDLDKITQIEQALILNIGKLEDRRERVLENIKRQLGIEADLNVSKLTENLKSNHKMEIEGITSKLLDTLKEIKEKNELNSILIKDSLEYINFNINLLTNTTPQNTYSDNITKGDTAQNKSIFDAKV